MLEADDRDAVSKLVENTTDTMLGLGLAARAVAENTTVRELVEETLVTLAEEGLERLKALGADDIIPFTLAMRRSLGHTGSVRQQTTDETRRVFLAAYEASGSMTSAAEVAGVSASLPYAWARADSAFKEQWNELRRVVGHKEV